MYFLMPTLGITAFLLLLLCLEARLKIRSLKSDLKECQKSSSERLDNLFDQYEVTNQLKATNSELSSNLDKSVSSHCNIQELISSVMGLSPENVVKVQDYIKNEIEWPELVSKHEPIPMSDDGEEPQKSDIVSRESKTQDRLEYLGEERRRRRRR